MVTGNQPELFLLLS